MKKMNGTNLAIIVTSLFLTGLIWGTDVFAADKDACSEDIAKFCQNVEPGMFSLMDCLEKHENELSGPCKEREATMGGRRVERSEQVRKQAMFRRACLNDMAKFCNDAGDGMLTCLNDHGKELSAACSESIKVMKN